LEIQRRRGRKRMGVGRVGGAGVNGLHKGP
jgi:hypothetical protein